MQTLPPPPVPARPDLATIEPAPRRRSRPWAILLSAVLAVSLAAAAISPLLSGGGTRVGADFAFLARTDAGQPVRWDPCEPIHYVVNASLAPSGSIGDVHEAVRRISEATGVAFVYDGITDEQVSAHRNAFIPSRYGERWAPILISWVDPDLSDIPFEHGGSVASGVATPLYPNGSPAEVYVSGWVALNMEDPNPPGFEHADEQGPVILHELGHVMGLGHVHAFGEIMDRGGGGVVDLGPGDREGLHRIGASAGCIEVPPARA